MPGGRNVPREGGNKTAAKKTAVKKAQKKVVVKKPQKKEVVKKSKKKDNRKRQLSQVSKVQSPPAKRRTTSLQHQRKPHSNAHRFQVEFTVAWKWMRKTSSRSG